MSKKWYKDDFWFDILRKNDADIENLKELIKKVCVHKTITQVSKDGLYCCDACGKTFIEYSLPKGSVICRYVCKVN